MKHLLVIVLLVVFLFAAGCGNKSQDTVVTPSEVTTKVPVKASTKEPQTTKTVITKTQTTAPTPVKIIEPNITGGFWCRDTTINIEKASTRVTECFQFFDDGTYKWGYSPGKPMGKSPSCSGAPNEKCKYSLNAQGKYEVEGGYSYKLDGVYLIDPHDPPYFIWTETGIP